MKTLIWHRDNGTYTFVVKFVNGNYAEYVGKPIDKDDLSKGNGWLTRKGAENGAEACRQTHGDNWELKNLAYDSYDDNGEKTAKFIRRNGN